MKNNTAHRTGAFLFNLATLHPSAARVDDAARMFAQGIDVDNLAKIASEHRLSGILLDHIQKKKLDFRFPAEITGRLKTDVEIGKMIAGFQSEVTAQIIDRMAALEVPVFLVKGMALVALGVYPDNVIRSMCDVDFLVDAGEMSRVNEAMHDLGFTTDAWERLEADTKILGEAMFHLKNNKTVEVEFSTRLNKTFGLKKAFPLGLVSFDTGAIDIELNGHKTKTVSLETQLGFMIFHHVAVNYLQQIIFVTDIVEFWRKFESEIDRERFSALVEKWNLGRAVAFLNDLLEEPFGVLLPGPDVPAPRLFAEKFNKPTQRFPTPPELEPKKDRLRISLMDSSIKKLGALASHVFPPLWWAKKTVPAGDESASSPVIYWKYYFHLFKRLLRGIFSR